MKNRPFNNYNAFTLAEILIVLVVIGVLTSILLPVAIQSSPDENVMKFKKGNALIGKVISELINSDKYYADGDLGKKANGDILKTGNENDIKYFCETFADVISTKSVNCSTHYESNHDYAYFDSRKEKEQFGFYYTLDIACKEKTGAGAEIVTTDGITFYQTAPNVHFGYIFADDAPLMEDRAQNNLSTVAFWLPLRLFSTPCKVHCDDNVPTSSAIYKLLCMDVDGIGVGEDPFAYGIRVDGKILYGPRAKEWMEKSLQKGED